MPPREPLSTYRVWDAPTRILHWLNAGLSLLLLAVGFLFMFRKELAIDGLPAKIALKEFHSSIGYVFWVTLGARIAWGFFGNRHVRWRHVLPGPSTVGPALREGRALLGRGDAPPLVGHGPLGRFSTALLLGLLLTLAVSGLVRAGTDLYYPPLGGTVARYVAKPGIDPATIGPLDGHKLDQDRVRRLNAVKTVFGTAHRYAAWAFAVTVVLHVAGVTLKDLRQGGGILSSMVTGTKVFAKRPEDAEEP